MQTPFEAFEKARSFHREQVAVQVDLLKQVQDRKIFHELEIIRMVEAEKALRDALDLQAEPEAASQSLREADRKPESSLGSGESEHAGDVVSDTSPATLEDVREAIEAGLEEPEAPEAPMKPTERLDAAKRKFNPGFRVGPKTQFRLRDDEGRYLHLSCLSMTTEKNNSWIGSEVQLLGCRKKYSLAADLIEEVVEEVAK